MSYLSAVLVFLLVVSPLIVPLLVTAVHATPTWRRKLAARPRRQRPAHTHATGLRPVQLSIVEP
jgi:hypothetical protein